MRKMVKKLIITFATTSAAMQMEELCEQEGLPGRLIPVPTQITAGCGLAWRTEPEEEARLLAAMKKANLNHQQIHIIDMSIRV